MENLLIFFPLRPFQVFLAVQNLAVAVAGIAMGLFFWKEEWILENWGDYMVTVMGVVIIVIGTVANVASQGSKIVVERDWIVVVAGRGNNDRLAAMNSVFRTIDLTCLVLAPAALGAFFDFIGADFTAFFIAGWNICSVALEYGLLVKIYKSVRTFGTYAEGEFPNLRFPPFLAISQAVSRPGPQGERRPGQERRQDRQGEAEGRLPLLGDLLLPPDLLRRPWAGLPLHDGARVGQHHRRLLPPPLRPGLPPRGPHGTVLDLWHPRQRQLSLLAVRTASS